MPSFQKKVRKLNILTQKLWEPTAQQQISDLFPATWLGTNCWQTIYELIILTFFSEKKKEKMPISFRPSISCH